MSPPLLNLYLSDEFYTSNFLKQFVTEKLCSFGGAMFPRFCVVLIILLRRLHINQSRGPAFQTGFAGGALSLGSGSEGAGWVGCALQFLIH